MKKIILILLMIGLCCGCQVNYQLEINKDLSVQENLKATKDSSFFEEYENSSMGRVVSLIIRPYLDTLNDNKYNVNNLITDSYGGVTINKKYKSLNEYSKNTILSSQFTDNIEYTSTFVVFAAHCTYTMFRRDKNDEQSEENSDYNFILTVFCPVELGEDILIFDEIDNNICLIPKKNRNISRVPSDGFLFPVLTGGDPDINSVLCYSSKPKEPNKSIVEKVLGCETSFTAIEFINLVLLVFFLSFAITTLLRKYILILQQVYSPIH